MNNEVTVIKPEQFGLEKKQALTIEDAFLPKIKEGEILLNQYGELIKKDITPEVCNEATQLGRKLVKVRTGIADVHKTQKAFFYSAGKFVDAKKNKETLPITQAEEGVKKIKNHFAEIKEAENEVIRKERNAELAKYEIEYDMGDIAFMTPDGWKHFLSGVKSEFEEKKADEARIEKERIAKEKAAIAEQKRIKAENERLKKEAELKRIADEKAEKERHRLAKIEQDKRDKIERERLAKAESERKEREASETKERAAHQAELKRVNDDRAKIQKAFEVRQEEARKAEQAKVDKLKSDSDAKRKAELAPDKERMTKWIADMTIIDIVNDRMSKESALMASEIIDKFNKFKTWATEKVNEIK